MDWTHFAGARLHLIELSLKDSVRSSTPRNIHNSLLKSGLLFLCVCVWWLLLFSSFFFFFHSLVCLHAFKLVDRLQDSVQEGFLLLLLMRLI